PQAERRDVLRPLELVQAVLVREGAAVHDLPDVVAVRRIVRVGEHRAELEDGERPLSFAEALLPEEHRAGRVALDAERDEGEEWRNEDERSGGYDDVDEPLRSSGHARLLQRWKADQRHPLDEMHTGDGADGFEEPRDEVDLN